MLAATVAGNALRQPAARCAPRPGAAGRQLAAIGIATETVRVDAAPLASMRSRGALRRPGFALQRMAATREPTAEELEPSRGPRWTRCCASRVGSGRLTDGAFCECGR